MHQLKVESNQGFIPIPEDPIDAVSLSARTKTFLSRSIKKDSKLAGLYLAIRMTDLTTLEGCDSVQKIRALCTKALLPVSQALQDSFQVARPDLPPIPQVAAVCVYPNFVADAKKMLAGRGVKVASVASGFPAGQVPIAIKESDVKAAILSGADEIDMVIDRGAFLSGDYQKVFDEIRRLKDLCGSIHLKVILETGELGTYDNIRLASWIAMEAGADFIKTSTGKISQAATMESTLVMLQAIADFYRAYGKKVGMKPAGGIRTAKQAIQYLVMLKETLGGDWLNPDLFRFGASSLLNDILRQISAQVFGQYIDQDQFSAD
ncbi:MAG: deoxyribose-phosphate aldolase [Oligoflexales bacterium]